MINPFSSTEKKLRPYLWGFFISVALLLVLVAARSGCAFLVEKQWIAQTSSRQEELAEIVLGRFNSRVADLFVLAGSVVKDRELSETVKERSPAGLAGAFERLDRYRQPDDASIDLVDSQGVVIAWSGRSVLRDYRAILGREQADSLVLIPQARLHRYLSVGLRSSDRRFYVVVNRPLEVNYPLSNRFVSRSSFSEELTQEIGSPVHLAFDSPPRDTVSPNLFVVPLENLRHEAVAYALILVPTVAAEIQRFDQIIDPWQATAIAVAAAFLAWVLFQKRRSFRSPVTRVLAGTILLWGVRCIWRIVDFPSGVIGGVLFDPSIYASPFVSGLASSLGELLLSCIALFLTSLALANEAIAWQGKGETRAQTSSTGKNVAAFLLAVLLGLGLQWIVRGFGAAMRSFVVDSTLQYQDPTNMMPVASVVVMHLNILVLTLSLLAVCVTVLLLMSSLVSRALKKVDSSRWVPMIVLGVLLGAYGIFLVVNKTPQTPSYYPVLVFLLSLYIASWFGPQREGENLWRYLSLRRVIIVGAVAFVLSWPLLDMWQHEKERQRVQVLADELMRPVDNWLSFVVSEGLRSTVAGANEGLAQSNSDYGNASNLAFLLWAQSLMSHEGYNSAVFVYSSQGKEISRFAVGLTTYEQMELLTQIFDTEEDVLRVVERKVQGGAVKYYGEWAHVLDSQGQQLGTVAVLVSASQRTLFRGEAPEALRTASRDSFEESFRKLSISEYQRGLLVSTTDPLLFRGLRLPTAIHEQFTASTVRFVWSEQNLGGQTYDVLFARDESREGRILALSLQSLDIRWHLFNIVKMLGVYLFYFGLAAVGHIARSYLRGNPVRFGFREKLVSSFALLSIVPLVVMASYNRELAIERLDDSITGRLAEDLDLIHQRIITSVTDEGDFFAGINNDYCEVAAADLGVDFSVYGGSSLQASSRPELYRAALLDDRLTGSAFVNTMMLGRSFFRDFERIGEVTYTVGYRPIIMGDRVVGVLAVPALYRQREIDEELAQRNAFVLGAYALVVLFVVIVGFILANRLSRPLRELSLAAQVIGKGNLDVQLTPQSSDEVGNLVQSFNEMTKELRVSREDLARAERELAWKEMAKQVAHEIKNPLTPIKLSIQHLTQAYKDGAKDFGQVLQRVSNTVIEQIEVLTRIASEFSNFARMPARKFERVDVKELLQETVTLFGGVRGIEFRTKFSETPAILIADRDELRRVFINVIRNSVQALEKGGTITVEMGISNQICTVSISDTGSGIPQELQAKVFQPNFSTKTDGMGLGLAIAQKVIEDLNGTVALRSEVGKGTTVEMRIPLRLG